MADLSDEQAFYYVDGIPTKGVWIDLDSIDDEDDILRELLKAGLIPHDEDDEDEPNYGGDLLVADVDGVVARCFLSNFGSFDLSGWQEVRDEAPRHVSAEAVAAYIDWMGSWSEDGFNSAYYGKFDSEKDFAKHYVDECWEVPDHIQGYIDYDAVARDLFVNDFYYDDDSGIVFRNC